MRAALASASRSSDDLRKRRILLTSLSGQLGGLELRMADEARVLQELDYASLLAISKFPGCDAWFDGLRREGLALTDFDPPPFFEHWKSRRLNWLRARFGAVEPVRRLQLDLIHVAFAWTLTGGSRLWIASHCGIPSIVSVHNCFPPTDLTPWHRRLAAKAFAGVRGIYGVSDSALSHFLASYGDYIRPNTRLSTIFNFVDVTRFVPSEQRRAATRKALGFSDDTLLIGSVGRIDTQKDPFSVLRVFARVSRRLPQARLLFVGTGPLDGQLGSEVAKLGLSDKVTMGGFRSDVENIYPALDVHLLLSKREGFGISTVEAMACAVPVVATDVPGTRDILHGEQGGVLVAPGDDSGVAEVVLGMLLDNAERRSRGSAGREAAMNRFSREIWKRNITMFYDSVLAADHRPTHSE